MLLASPVVAFILVALCSCGAETDDAVEQTARVDAPTETASAQTFVRSDPPPEENAPSAVPATDHYADWGSWCEPMWYDTACQEHDDCAGIKHVAGRPLRCVRPFWGIKSGAKGPDGKPLKVCAPGYTRKTERRWRRARLREFVAQAYFDEPENCPSWSWEMIGAADKPKRFVREWANGKPTHHQHWRCSTAAAKAQKLANFLWVPYFRETTARPWKRHRLNPDVVANVLAWVNEASVFGWKVEMLCADGRNLEKDREGRWRDQRGRGCAKRNLVVGNYYPDPEADRHNPHFGERDRWQYGLGPVGKNTAYGTQDWDVMAPPEILCREPEGFEAYLRDVRHAVRTFRSNKPPVCNGIPYRGRAIRHVKDAEGKVISEFEVLEPSWYDAHRVASGGKFCPRKSAKAADYRRKFAKRMESAGLRPDEPVTIDMLGRPISRDTQNEVASEIHKQLDAKLPSPWSAHAANEPPAELAPAG